MLSSTSTAKYDRTVKMPACAREGVGHAWLVDRVDRTLEVYRNLEGKWLQVATHTDDEKVRVEPFESLEFDLAGESPIHSPGGALTKSVKPAWGPNQSGGHYFWR